MRVLTCVLCSAAMLTNGCVAIVIPAIAAGTIGGKQIFDKKDDAPEAPEVAKKPKAPKPPKPGKVKAVGTVSALPEPVAPPPPPAVPSSMQYLYGSGEAAALSTQSYSALVRYLRFTSQMSGDRVTEDVLGSVTLTAQATLAAPTFGTCGKKKHAVVLDIDETSLLNLGFEADESQHTGPYDPARWERWEATGANAVAAVPGALAAITEARKLGITVVFNSNRSTAQAQATVEALDHAGLGPAVLGDTLWLRDGPSGKDARRAAISEKYCVIAMVGDQLGDFSDLFDAPGQTLAQRRALAISPQIAELWGQGWFLLPNPVYGAGARGTVDEVFPADKRWTDPGAVSPGGYLPADTPPSDK
ncbi:5'-nucleotidase, lipoprotein e(P4) family [Sphingomonas immobilis]|uniref:HAD family acid phosphatase n=1 Tax=Sphingomonas immobilis TaxID=3063997 RepID=A0ABT8ZTZ5_9SPHN|nr:HAD family acid phosphatase [Sphingomonas sp. CA1-15]MDO7841034.1 HAD family acid phosphatase [Sphingomonas sp. CA1-15]